MRHFFVKHLTLPHEHLYLVQTNVLHYLLANASSFKCFAHASALLCFP